jgi:hypothetical protein
MKRSPRPAADIPEEAARILFLTYGQDAVHMAELRCSELEAVGDKGGRGHLERGTGARTNAGRCKPRRSGDQPLGALAHLMRPHAFDLRPAQQHEAPSSR